MFVSWFSSKAVEHRGHLWSSSSECWIRGDCNHDQQVFTRGFALDETLRVCVIVPLWNGFVYTPHSIFWLRVINMGSLAGYGALGGVSMLAVDGTRLARYTAH